MTVEFEFKLKKREDSTSIYDESVLNDLMSLFHSRLAGLRDLINDKVMLSCDSDIHDDRCVISMIPNMFTDQILTIDQITKCIDDAFTVSRLMSRNGANRTIDLELFISIYPLSVDECQKRMKPIIREDVIKNVEYLHSFVKENYSAFSVVSLNTTNEDAEPHLKLYYSMVNALYRGFYEDDLYEFIRNMCGISKFMEIR